MSPNIYRAKRLQSSAVLLPIFLLFSYFLITYTTPFHHCMYVCIKGVLQWTVHTVHSMHSLLLNLL